MKIIKTLLYIPISVIIYAIIIALIYLGFVKIAEMGYSWSFFLFGFEILFIAIPVWISWIIFSRISVLSTYRIAGILATILSSIIGLLYMANYWLFINTSLWKGIVLGIGYSIIVILITISLWYSTQENE